MAIWPTKSKVITVLKIFFDCLFIFERKRWRETEHKQGRGREREGDTESKPVPGSELSERAQRGALTHKP